MRRGFLRGCLARAGVHRPEPAFEPRADSSSRSSGERAQRARPVTPPSPRNLEEIGFLDDDYWTISSCSEIGTSSSSDEESSSSGSSVEPEAVEPENFESEKACEAKSGGDTDTKETSDEKIRSVEVGEMSEEKLAWQERRSEEEKRREEIRRKEDEEWMAARKEKEEQRKQRLKAALSRMAGEKRNSWADTAVESEDSDASSATTYVPVALRVEPTPPAAEESVPSKTVEVARGAIPRRPRDIDSTTAEGANRKSSVEVRPTPVSKKGEEDEPGPTKPTVVVPPHRPWSTPIILPDPRYVPINDHVPPRPMIVGAAGVGVVETETATRTEGPPGVAAHALWGGPAAPRQRERRVNLNPRRHLEAEDYESTVREPTPTTPRRISSSQGDRAASAAPYPSSQRGREEARQELRRPRERSASRVRTPREQSRTRELPIKTEGAQFGGLTPIPTDPSIDPPPHSCFNCWQPDHSRRQCVRPMALFCYNCGRRGETLNSCPRCSEPHRRFMSESRSNATVTTPAERPAAQSIGVHAAPSTQMSRRDEPTNRFLSPRSRVRNAGSREVAVGTAPRTDRAEVVETPRRTAEPASTADTTAPPATGSSSADAALRLLQELRAVPADIRDAILRQVYQNTPTSRPPHGH